MNPRNALLEPSLEVLAAAAGGQQMDAESNLADNDRVDGDLNVRGF